MTNPTAAVLVIGDEILSGRTLDTNTHHLAGRLSDKGIDLCEVRVVPDDADKIAETVKSLSQAYDHVFTSGGIGPTHDDITADSVGAAFGAKVDVRGDARTILQAHYDRTGSELNDARLRMARIPEGATLIENPVSAAPGFILKNVHVMAGVPAVFKAMVESVLPGLTGGAPLISRSVRIERGEGDIAGPLAKIAEEFADLSFGSYPFSSNGVFGANIVIRGEKEDLVSAAESALRSIFEGSVT